MPLFPAQEASASLETHRIEDQQPCSEDFDVRSHPLELRICKVYHLGRLGIETSEWLEVSKSDWPKSEAEDNASLLTVQSETEQNLPKQLQM